jgi:hypothetical protein
MTELYLSQCIGCHIVTSYSFHCQMFCVTEFVGDPSSYVDCIVVSSLSLCHTSAEISSRTMEFCVKENVSCDTNMHKL